MSDPKMNASTKLVVSKNGLIACSCCSALAWVLTDAGFLIRVTPSTLAGTFVKWIDTSEFYTENTRFKAFGDYIYFCGGYVRRYDSGGNMLLHLAVPCIDLVVANDIIFMACSDGTLRAYSVTGTLLDSKTVTGFTPLCVDAKYVNLDEYGNHLAIFYGGIHDGTGGDVRAAVHCTSFTNSNDFEQRWHWVASDNHWYRTELDTSQIYVTRDGLDARCVLMLSADWPYVAQSRMWEVEAGVLTWQMDNAYDYTTANLPGWMVSNISGEDLLPVVIVSDGNDFYLFDLTLDTRTKIDSVGSYYGNYTFGVPVQLSDATIVSYILACDKEYWTVIRLFNKSDLTTPILTKNVSSYGMGNGGIMTVSRTI